jgi:hypothetical protein
MRQVADADLSAPGPGGQNSMAIVVWHISGNLASRFTDFLTTDGEKEWRHRDEEFEPRLAARSEVLEKWERGWGVLFATLGTLSDADLAREVRIRSHPHQVIEALHRALAHVSYHVGQIVMLARAVAGERWQSLSIPPGQSEAYRNRPR